MKRIALLFVIAAAFWAFPIHAQQSHASDEPEQFNPGSIIIGHVTNSHSWHMFDFVDKQGVEHSVAVPLPIILINNGHLDVFSVSRFHHGHQCYKGYRLIGGGLEAEEIICVDADGQPLLDSTGAVIKPIDLSITKVPAAIMIISIILIVVVMIAKHGYKKRENQTPKGLQSLVEMLVCFVRDSIAIPMIGQAKYQKYLPYLLTLFFFIFLSNCMGLIPFFPAGANVTGCIAVTATLAVITFFITNISGNKHYWIDIFNTPGVPAWLKIFPLMPLIEVVGIFTKPIVLMIRLFANMTAGHIVVLGFVVIIFILSNTLSMGVGAAVSVFSVLFSVFISVLECLVAYIQAFVFTMLTALYIGMAVEDHHNE
ncbi:MAG: F0F1 ATP synthase subunit A [Bacteroidales bacterium]|nr:F0F1 ATP synthase subunit A [Candidatus Colimorpha merdihippi]MCQ2281621.1 F0F1 ATP synthase subunit A [Bacteroidales bacterium]